MTEEQWRAAHLVAPMDWDELNRWSERLRKLAHDVNNALVPAFAHADLLRLKLGHQANLSQLSVLPAQLELARMTVQRSVSAIVRQPGAIAPTWRNVQLELMMHCRQASTAFSWEDPADDAAHADWPTSDARHVLRALIHNSCEAINAAESGHVTLRIRATPTYVDFSVSDNGPGCTDLPAAAQTKLVRHGHGHLGLGLTSAATVARRNLAELRIANAPNGGFLAMLRVPRRKSAEA